MTMRMTQMASLQQNKGMIGLLLGNVANNSNNTINNNGNMMKKQQNSGIG